MNFTDAIDFCLNLSFVLTLTLAPAAIMTVILQKVIEEREKL